MLHETDESVPLQGLVGAGLDLVLPQERRLRGQVEEHVDGPHPEVDAIGDLEGHTQICSEWIFLVLACH